MSNRDARNQEGYSLKASDAVHDDNVYDEVDMNESTRKKRETEFVDSAHYAAIAEGHLTKESHYETVTKRMNTAEKDKPVIIDKGKETKRRCCSKIVLCLSVFIIVVVIASCVCFTLAFLEISRLKSEIISLQKVTATSIASSGEEWCSSVECISIPNIFNSLYWLNESYRIIENQQSETRTSFDMLNRTLSRTENQLQLLNETLTASFQQSLSATQQNNLTAVTQFQFLNMTLTGQFLTFPVSSCAALLELHPFSPSNYYWIRSSNGSAVHVYCDMTLSCGGVTGGWMRVANLDMRDFNAQCPGTLTERINSSIRTCETPSASCYQVTYSTKNIDFIEVCGKIRAYQVGVINGFSNSNGAEGIILFYGIPRQHIWTFVAAQSEVGNPSSNCLCTNINQASSAGSPPAFVGE